MPLKVSDGAAAWIKDFKKSDAPQFKGKSDKERRDMALAAYLSAKNEDVRSADKKPETYIKPDGKPGIRMVPVNRQVVKSEKVVGFKIHPKLPNLKVPIKRKQGKIYNKKTGQFEDVKEAAPKPLNRSNHTHTVDISGEGRYRVKAKSMDHAKKVAFKQAGISKLHGHPTMEPKTRIYGESVKEETSFEVKIEGLPMMFMSDMGPGQLKQKLRKIVKQPSMISSVKRVTDADVKKTFRLKAQGRDEEENEVDESSYDKINKYYDAAKKNKDRATNSAVATILRKGDHSKDLNTMRKREKGIKLAKSRITDKIRKGQKT